MTMAVPIPVCLGSFNEGLDGDQTKASNGIFKCVNGAMERGSFDHFHLIE